jgi:hypothetical protein
MTTLLNNVASEWSLSGEQTNVVTSEYIGDSGAAANACASYDVEKLFILWDPKLSLYRPRAGIEVANLTAQLVEFSCIDARSVTLTELAAGLRISGTSPWTPGSAAPVERHLLDDIQHQMTALASH